MKQTKQTDANVRSQLSCDGARIPASTLGLPFSTPLTFAIAGQATATQKKFSFFLLAHTHKMAMNERSNQLWQWEKEGQVSSCCWERGYSG